MRLIQGIILGIAITIGAAFVHDNMVPANAGAPLLQQQQVVNWDVLGRLANDGVNRAKALWHQLLGR